MRSRVLIKCSVIYKFGMDEDLRGYSYALKAARDAIHIHSGALNFSDALRTAAGLYTSSWIEFQSRKQTIAAPIKTRTAMPSSNSTPSASVCTHSQKQKYNRFKNTSDHTPPLPNPTLGIGQADELGEFARHTVSDVPFGRPLFVRFDNRAFTKHNNTSDGMFPTASSQTLFAYNHNIQSVLMERDPLLCKVDIFLREALATSFMDGTIFTFRKLMANYLLFMQNEYVVNDGPPFCVPFNLPQTKARANGDLIYKFQTIKFPSRRAWAAFAALYFLWKNTPCAPRFKMVQLYSGFKHTPITSSAVKKNEEEELAQL